MTLPPIYFLLDKHSADDHLPVSSNELWSPKLLRNTKHPLGVYHWILETYIHLKEQGLPCELVHTMPDEGIILAHRDSLPNRIRPGPRRVLVCVIADRYPHAYAQLHVVENPNTRGLGRRPRCYIPAWPQTGLVPRDPSRGDTFENVAYAGGLTNLCVELRAKKWAERLRALGLAWHTITDPLRYHDLSSVDALLAVRSFNGDHFHHKPPTKLLIAWRAGIPAVLGPESAYQAERKSELDYIEVRSVQEASEAISSLKASKELRSRMAAHGRLRAREFTVAKLAERWRRFLTDQAVPCYERWRRGSAASRALNTVRGHFRRLRDNYFLRGRRTTRWLQAERRKTKTGDADHDTAHARRTPAERNEHNR